MSNPGIEPLPIEGIFATPRLWLRYLERNPAPGTEAHDPQPAMTVDFRTGEITFDE